MNYRDPARTTNRGNPSFAVAALLVVIAAIVAVLGYPLLASLSATVAPPIPAQPNRELPTRQPVDDHADQQAADATQQHADRQETQLRQSSPESPPIIEQQGQEHELPANRGDEVHLPQVAPPQQVAAEPQPAPDEAPPRLSREQRGAAGDLNGVIPDGTTVFDDAIPGVANLDPALLAALREAAADAANDGVAFFVNSGWRSPEYQEQLLREAVSIYGSEEESARWVATPTTSAHVSGQAVDIGPYDATAWLSEHGAAYGLCQIYGNEPWHYELRPEAIEHGCPPIYPDPTYDPRMQP